MSESQLKAEQKLRELIRKSYFIMNEVETKQKFGEQRLREALRRFIIEAKDKQFHASTGVNELGVVLDSIYVVSKDAYMRLATSPDQRKAYLMTWEWLFKEAFSGDVKRRNAAEKAAEQVAKGGFKAQEEPEEEGADLQEGKDLDGDGEDDKIVMKVTDPDLNVDEPETEPTPEETEQEEEESRISDLVSAPDDMDRTGPDAAMNTFHNTKTTILKAFDTLRGDDSEKFYKWFFINMLGSERSGFADVTQEPVIGHFQNAEKELEGLGIPTDPALLPPEDANELNLSSDDF
jgi:hypothetical protein